MFLICIATKIIYFIYSGKTKLVDALCTLSNRHVSVDTIDDSVTGSFQQIDLNRHLEEISQATEKLLTHRSQIHILNNNFDGDLIDLLRSWETFVVLSMNNSGKNNDNFFYQCRTIL